MDKKFAKLIELNAESRKLFKSGYMTVSMIELGNFVYEKIYEKYTNPGTKEAMDSILRYRPKKAQASNFLEKLPCSSIKEGFCNRLFVGSNNVGLVFDIQKADIIYTAQNIIWNSQSFDELFVKNLSIYNSTDKIQRKNDFILAEAAGGYKISTGTSEAKNKRCLKAIDKSWEEIKKDGFENYYDRSLIIDIQSPMVTENIVNLKKVNDLNGLAYHSVTPPEYKKIEKYDEDYDNFIYCVVLKGLIDKECGTDLKVFHYEKKKYMDFTPPELSGVRLDKEKIKEILKKSRQDLPPVAIEAVEYVCCNLKTNKNSQITHTSVKSSVGQRKR